MDCVKFPTLTGPAWKLRPKLSHSEFCAQNWSYTGWNNDSAWKKKKLKQHFNYRRLKISFIQPVPGHLCPQRRYTDNPGLWRGGFVNLSRYPIKIISAIRPVITNPWIFTTSASAGLGLRVKSKGVWFGWVWYLLYVDDYANYIVVYIVYYAKTSCVDLYTCVFLSIGLL